MLNMHENTLNFPGNLIKDRCKDRPCCRLGGYRHTSMELAVHTHIPAGNQNMHLLLQESHSHRDSGPLFRVPMPHSYGQQTPHMLTVHHWTNLVVCLVFPHFGHSPSVSPGCRDPWSLGLLPNAGDRRIRTIINLH